VIFLAKFERFCIDIAHCKC